MLRLRGRLAPAAVHALGVVAAFSFYAFIPLSMESIAQSDLFFLLSTIVQTLSSLVGAPLAHSYLALRREARSASRGLARAVLLFAISCGLLAVPVVAGFLGIFGYGLDLASLSACCMLVFFSVTASTSEIEATCRGRQVVFRYAILGGRLAALAALGGLRLGPGLTVPALLALAVLPPFFATTSAVWLARRDLAVADTRRSDGALLLRSWFRRLPWTTVLKFDLLIEAAIANALAAGTVTTFALARRIVTGIVDLSRVGFALERIAASLRGDRAVAASFGIGVVPAVIGTTVLAVFAISYGLLASWPLPLLLGFAFFSLTVSEVVVQLEFIERQLSGSDVGALRRLTLALVMFTPIRYLAATLSGPVGLALATQVYAALRALLTSDPKGLSIRQSELSPIVRRPEPSPWLPGSPRPPSP